MGKIDKKVLIAMSGGVDSSVVAGLLSQEYADLMGIFLIFWKDDSNIEVSENKCCSTKSLMDARSIASKFSFPFYTLNYAEEFKSDIVDNFLSEYREGKTPNPCVLCNKKIKLGRLIQKADDLGYHFLASGHYARVENVKGTYKLYKAKDKSKDQSYFLYRLGQKELSRILFPLGGFSKKEVREMAEKMNLPVAQKKESQEICFISGKSHNDFLKKHLNLKPGDIVDKKGNKMGRHNGLPLYTIGQRKGIELGGDGPYYVSGFDFKKNILFVTNDRDDEALYRKGFDLRDVNWISGREPVFPLKTKVVIRYHHREISCQVINKKNKISVLLDEPARAVTPGQSAVFYDKDEVLGGGTIL